MTGCIFKRRLPSGLITWGYTIYVGKDASGKRKQLFKSGFRRKVDADNALRSKLNEKEHGDLIRPDPMTLAGFLHTWLTEHAPRRRTPKTLERYAQLADCALPHIGSIRLQDLTALVLERAFNTIKDGGGHDRKKNQPRPISAKTVHHIADVINGALKKAVKLKLLKSNPMEGVELPAVQHREANVLDSEKVSQYLDAARAHGLYELLMFAAGSGCRRGEALAMSWADVDLVRGSVKIAKSLEQTEPGLRVKSTKTQRERTISLPSSLIEILKFHREKQEESRRLFNTDYQTDLDLVVRL